MTSSCSTTQRVPIQHLAQEEWLQAVERLTQVIVAVAVLGFNVGCRRARATASKSKLVLKVTDL